MDFKRFNLVWVFCSLFVNSITYVSLTPSDSSASDKRMMNQSKLRKRQTYPTEPSFQPPVSYPSFYDPSNYQPSTYNEEYSYSPIYQSSYYNWGYPYSLYFPPSYYNGGYPSPPTYSGENGLRTSPVRPYSFDRQASSSPNSGSTYSTNPNLFNSPSRSSSSQWNDLSKGHIYAPAYTNYEKVTEPQFGSFYNNEINSFSPSPTSSTSSNTEEMNSEISPRINEDQPIFKSTRKGRALLEILKTFGKNVAVYSPMGFMQLFSLLYLAVDLQSKSSRDLARFLPSKKKKKLIQHLKTTIEEYNAKNVLLANAYAAQKEISSSLVKKLRKSNTKHLSNQADIDNFLKDGTQGLLKELKIELKDNSILFINLIALKLKWLTKAFLTPQEMSFTFKDTTKTPKRTKFAIHQLNSTLYFNEDGIEACIIPFEDEIKSTTVKENDGSTAQENLSSLSAFIIKQKKGSLSMEELWPIVFKKFNNPTLSPKEVHVTLPRFRVTGEIVLTHTHLPKVLRKNGIKDFESFMIPSEQRHLYEFKIQQNTEMCVDENGAIAVSVTMMNTVQLSLGTPSPTIFRVDSTFTFVVADRESGFPLFVAEVDSVLPTGENCSS